MTISTTTRKAGPYAGNGVAVSFAFGFKVFQKSDLRVVLTSADDIESTLVLDSDYSVTLNGNQDVSPGGSVSYPLVGSPMAAGNRLTLVSDVPDLQQTDITNGSGFYPSVIEDALDNSVILIQQNTELLNRALIVPVSTPDNVSTALPFPAPNNVIGWNADGDALQNFDPNLYASVVAYGTARRDLFTGDGVQTVFVLSANPAIQANLDVDIAGSTKAGGVDFTWSSGLNVTFSNPPADGALVQIRYLQALPQGTIDAGSVTGLVDPSTGFLTTLQAYLSKLFSSAGATLVGYIQSGTGAIYRSALDKLRERVTPADFGAVGDGVTDDTVAIQRWVNRGGNLYAGEPAVEYLLTGEIAVPSGTVIKGNPSKSIFRWVSGSRSAFTATNATNISIVGIKGVSTVDSSSQYALFKIKACSNITMSECVAENGFLFRSDSTSATYGGVNAGNSCSDIMVFGNRYKGTRLLGAQGAISIYYTNGAIVSGNTLRGCPGGVQWWGGDANPINDGILSAARKCTNLSIYGNRVIDCEAGIWGSMGRGVTVTGNMVSSCTDVGIDLEGTFDFSVTGNYVEHPGAACYSAFYDVRDGVFSGNMARVTSVNAGTRYGLWFTGTAASNNTRAVKVVGNTLISELGPAVVAPLILNDAAVLLTDCSFENNTLIDGSMQIRRQRSPVLRGNTIKWPTINVNGPAIFADGNNGHVIDGNTLIRSVPDSAPSSAQSAIYLVYVDATYNNGQYSCSQNRVNGWNTFAIYDEYSGAGQSLAAIVGNGVSGQIAHTGAAAVFQGLVSGNYSYANPSVPVTATTY